MSNTFKGTTLTFLPEVHLNCSFIFLPPSAPSPGLGDALFTARKNDSSILLLGTMFSFISRRQQEVVYFLAFLSLCVTFLGHLPKKEEKKKEYHTLHFYVFFYSRLLEDLTNILWFRARLPVGGRNHSSPTKQILPCLLPGSLGGGTWVVRCWRAADVQP